MILTCPEFTRRLKGCEPWPNAESVLTVEARVKKRMGHSGPRTLAKWRISGMRVCRGRVSTITATFLPIGNKSPDAELGVVKPWLNGASRLERDR